MDERAYLAALDAFEEIRTETRVTATDASIYYRIAWFFRKCKYPDSMVIGTMMLAELEGVSTETVRQCRVRLEKLGVISCKTGHGKQTLYTLLNPNINTRNYPILNANTNAMPFISGISEGDEKADPAQVREDTPTQSQDIINNINIPHTPEIEGVRGRKRARRTAEPDARFDRFWAAYPRKVGKESARKSWAKLKVTDELLAAMLTALEAQKKTETWCKDGGQYIPHPSTWLNGKRWEDELTTATEMPKQEDKPKGDRWHDRKLVR
jgi:hypothetical protein